MLTSNVGAGNRRPRLSVRLPHDPRGFKLAPVRKEEISSGCPVHHSRSQLRRQRPQRARARDRVLLLGQLLPRVDASEPEGAYRRRPVPGRGKRGLQSPAHSKPRRAELHQGPAKEITFDFSAPVEDSSGFVLSDLRFFKEGLPFLEPEAQITHHWDYLPNLIPMLKERGLEDGIKVTTKYKDLAANLTRLSGRYTRCS